MRITRKDFLRLALTTGGAALAAACGGSESTPQRPAGNCLANGTGASISGNHGHVLNVPKADVMAGAEKTYDIEGSAGHSHLVTLSAADMTTLQQNMQAQRVSTVELSHSHTITVFCV